MRVPTYGEIALKLLDNGYEPLPLWPGRKYPVLDQWSTLRIDEAVVRAWAAKYPHCGVGLRTGSLVGVDIDVMDPDLAHAAAEIVRARLGPTLLRVGWWPKRLLIYGTERPIAKLSIHECEILGLGQQMAAFGVHPDTGRPYHWPEDSPLDVPFENLPLVDETAFRKLLGELAQILPAGPPSRGKPRSRGGSNGQARSGPTLDETGLVVDGRDAYLSTLAFHAVHDALDRGDPPDAAALRDLVWSRFASNADLSRPKKDGALPYAPKDAARKVADKLRLLRDGRLPPRGSGHLEPSELPPQLPVEDARAKLEAILAEACARVQAWHAGEKLTTAPQIGVKATVGLGKSSIARRRLIELRKLLAKAGAPSRILVFTSSLALADETARAWRAAGERVVVHRGYEARHPTLRRPMCGDREAVKAALEAGVDVQSSACLAGSGARCALFEGCPKQANRRDVAEADVVVGAYDGLYISFAVHPDTIGLIVIDEGCWARAQEELGGLQLESFAHELLNATPRSRKREAFAEAADLHALRRRAVAAFTANGEGPLARTRLIEAGLTAEDARLAGELEQRRIRDPGLYPGMPQEARKDAMRQARINARSRLYGAAWEAMLRLLTGDREVDGRIEIGAPDAKTGLRPITLRRRKSIHPSLRGKPVLHLDATLRPELARTVLPELEVSEIAADAPHTSLRLVTGPFGKSGLCDDPRAADPERKRRANRLAECVDYVRWHAPRFERTLVVTYKDVEAAFAGVADVETAHFNAVSGLDAYRDVGLLIVIGRPLPHDGDLRRTCGTIFGHVPSGGYAPVRAGVRLRSDTVAGVRVTRHDDPQAEVLRAAICDDEVIQAIGRGRGVNRTAANPLEVHVLANVALLLVHDGLSCWDMEAPDVLQRMLLAGVAVDSPSDAAALHPTMFRNVEQAKKAFQRSPFRGHFPMDTPYREMSPKSAAYRRPGKGRPWQRACWIDGDADDARAALERVLGRRAGWKPG